MTNKYNSLISKVSILSPYQNQPDKPQVTSLISKKQEVSKEISDKITISKEALMILSKLKMRDREVKAHERAHVAAGGIYVKGAINYQYEIGPDGKKYAVGGEVKIDTSPEKDPEATIKKMEVVKRAALAPAHPSSQDRAVAAKAQQEIQKAQAEIMKEKSASRSQGSKNSLQTLSAAREDG